MSSIGPDEFNVSLISGSFRGIKPDSEVVEDCAGESRVHERRQF